MPVKFKSKSKSRRRFKSKSKSSFKNSNKINLFRKKVYNKQNKGVIDLTRVNMIIKPLIFGKYAFSHYSYLTVDSADKLTQSYNVNALWGINYNSTGIYEDIYDTVTGSEQLPARS